MSSVLQEEFEVLESIYPSELSIVSDRKIEIDVEPDVAVDGAESFKLKLSVSYTAEYPDVLPDLQLEAVDGEITESESDALLKGLLNVAEEARTRGTPVTIVSFKAWKANFDKAMLQKKLRDEGDKLRAFTPKERDEFKKIATRLTGRQLFERNRNLQEDDSLMEEGTVSVDFSQYDRTQVVEEDNEEELVHFSDSD
ncbi:RWD-domain-containing protein [Chiua virens]|nr:RWD-domain-containing protein [Chiua virens]